MSIKGPSIKPEMNVTPLVDVVLVLLIIFMVIAPQMEAGAAVDLPAVVHVDPKKQATVTPMMLSVTAGGEIYFEREVVAPAQLSERLQIAHENEPKRKVTIKADRAARYGDVRNLYRACREVGFAGVALQVGDPVSATKDDKEAGRGL